MPVNGKKKGSQYEREVCKRLSLWVSDFKQQDCFWRSAMSGGRATTFKKKTGKSLDTCAGDITCTHPLGQALTDRFVIECKNYKDLKLENYFFGVKSLVTDFWETLLEQCDGKREPLLIAKQNQKTEIVCTSSAGLRLLRFGGAVHPIVVVPAADLHCLLFRNLLTLKFGPIRKATKLRMARLGFE